LQQVNLSNNNLGETGGLAFAEALAQWTCRVKTVNLSNNRLGPRGGKAVAEAIITEFSVTDVDLSNNLLTGLDKFGNGKYTRMATELISDCVAETNLTSISLADNALRSADAESLGEDLMNCKTLTHMDLSSNQLCNLDALGRGVQDVTGLKLLSLGIGKSSVTSLNLSSNYLGVDGAVEVSVAVGNDILRLIDLSNTALCGINWKREGEYAKKGIVSVSLAIVDNDVIEYINLADNFLREPGAKAVALALSRSQCLLSIDLHGNNNLGQEGGMAIVNGIASSPSLMACSLNASHIGTVAKQKLLEAVQRREGFDLQL